MHAWLRHSLPGSNDMAALFCRLATMLLKTCKMLVLKYLYAIIRESVEKTGTHHLSLLGGYHRWELTNECIVV